MTKIRQLVVLFLICPLVMFSATGCSESASVDVSCSVGQPCGIKIHGQVTNSASPSTILTQASQTNQVLVDADTYNFALSGTAPTLTLTVTTDTGKTFVNSFSMVRTSASQYSPAASNTTVYAFSPQSPSALQSWLQWAVGQANSSVTVTADHYVYFNDNSDGSVYTFYNRGYNSNNGVFNVGSASYSGGGHFGGCTTSPCIQ